jgi:C1A family cysteine protease
MDNSFSWVKTNGGLCTDADYPWASGMTGTDGTCDTSCTNLAGTAPTSYTDVVQGSISDLQDAVYRQPVSIMIQANQVSIKQYKSGVFTGVCGQRLDHGCLAVGYGTDTSVAKDYWNVKNSWGTAWGEVGYIRIEKSAADRCGVLDLPSYPNL